MTPQILDADADTTRLITLDRHNFERLATGGVEIVVPN